MPPKIYRENKATVFSFISVLLSIYILLFEFIIPANRILPKPSILIDSFSVLFVEYDFFPSFIYTFSALYALMLVSFLLMRFGHKVLFLFADILPGLKDIFIIGRYIIPLFLILLFNLWFDDYTGEYLFILILLMGAIKSAMIKGLSEVPAEYIESAKSLNMNKDEIYSKVIYKYLQPRIIDTYINEHIQLLGWILVYEYLNMNIGIGYIIAQAIEYKDLSIIIILISIIAIIFIFMDFLLKQIKKNNFFWK